MARVTVEDCITRVPNRFELVLLAGQRARAISAGSPLTVERDHDKNPVVALREIADGTVEVDQLRQNVIGQMQKRVEVDEPEEDNMAVLLQGADWAQSVRDAEERPESTGDGAASDGPPET